MSYLPFVCSTIISILLVFPGFYIAQYISIKKGHIPRKDIKQWFGRKFLHWNDYLTQKYGDLVFLSLFNGYTIQLLSSKEITYSAIYLSALTGGIITYLWYRKMLNVFKDNKTLDWNWGFTYPNGLLTFAGKYHLLYFFLEITIIVFALIYLLPIENLVNASLLIVLLLGYMIIANLDKRAGRIHI